MLLREKNAVVYGGAGAMGSAVATAFAREGATVHLAGRTVATLEEVADRISADGGKAEVAWVDALDETSVEEHAEQVVARAGTLDISFNAIDVLAVQNIPLTEMGVDDFMSPIVNAARTHFLTGRAAARRMTRQGSGVILLLSSTAARESRHQMGGFNLACAGIEAFTRSLAGEVGPSGVRVVCLRPNFTPETVPGIDESNLGGLLGDTILGRLPRLAEVAGTAVYLASDAAGAMTGAVVNLSCGAIVD